MHPPDGLVLRVDVKILLLWSLEIKRFMRAFFELRCCDFARACKTSAGRGDYEGTLSNPVTHRLG